eukprot:TRINITY_DN12629_c0_g1_i5.p1 TRINITY_DN12629_c0_g1~~TRINITY_DN12629_c0_g1_i5.p1  ORF type:complete len:136 (+),score=31.29 TRINITY_DN12629_c0_g1_i5:313-720(+)
MIILGLTVFFVFVVAIIQTMQTDYYSNNYFFTALVVQWVSAIILIIFLAWWFFRKPKPVDEEAYGGVVPGDQVEGSSSSDGDHIRKVNRQNGQAKTTVWEGNPVFFSVAFCCRWVFTVLKIVDELNRLMRDYHLF